MTTPSLLNQLRELRFLEGIGDEAVEQIAEIARMVEFAAGAMIFRQGEPAKKIYLVVHGTVSLEISAPGVGCRRLMTIERGELLAWSPLLGHTQLTATARALTPTEAVEMSASQVLAMCEQNARLGYELLRQVADAMASRLNATRLQLIDIYGSQMPETDY